ncbi:hypothetical protein SAMN05421665_2849 [Yoonia rosea]|uniref:Tetratricopeptide repeat-containing protein n=2 Tax=Yoonia rosea TaxID=287098 RepID=A0A1R3XCF6_9RHOB|nr:hypothetical protein SAMN05421665_2849 [Yoonia rosea]
MKLQSVKITRADQPKGATNLRNLARLCAMAVMISSADAQPTQSLQEQAEAALVAGAPATTLRLAQEMLRAQPEDFAALYLLALAQSDLNDPQSAAASGARAYAAATSQDTRFETARFVAGAYFQAGHYTRSAFWLRRAANHASTEADLQFIAEAYANTVRTNPLSVAVTAAIAPTDNINNGSEDGILRLEGIDLTFVLPEDRRALSGIGFSASTDLRYRISETAHQVTTVTATLAGDTYLLSDDAKSLIADSPDPEVRAIDGRDFATVTASVGIERQQNNISPLGPLSLGTAFGTYWEGGERLVDFHDLSLEQTVPLTNTSRLQLRALRRWQDARTPALDDTNIYDITIAYDRLLANRDQLRLSLISQRNAAGPENSFDEYQIGIGYLLAEPVLGAQISTSLNIGFRTFEEFTTTLDGRDDHFYLASVTAVFEDVSYFGFSPSVTVSGARTHSTAEENTSAAAQILFGVASRF